MNRDEYVDSVKEAFVSLAKKAVMSRLASEAPKIFLGKIGSVINPLMGMLVERVLVIAAKEAETQAFFLYIDTRIGSQSKDFEKAAEENFKAQQGGTPEQKLAAEAKLKKEFAKFARLTS